MSLSILDGRRNFWQWDSGQRLLVGDAACGEVHYCNGTGDCALVTKIETLESGLRVAAVPNILLQSSDTIVAYLYQVDEHGARTRQDYRFRVLPRNRPDNYVYTEDEVLRWERLEERIDEIEKNGAPGPAGPQGPQGERGEDGKTPEVRILMAVEENTNGGTRYGVTIEGPKIVSENGTITHNKGTVWDGKDGKPGLSMYTFDPDKGLSEDGTLDRSFVNVPDGYYVKQNDLLLAPNGDIYLAGVERNGIGQFIRHTATFVFSIKGEHVCEDGGSAFDPTVYGLPILYLTGDTTGMSKDDAVSLGYVYGELSGTAEVKWQGSSSLAYDKKNYTIKFDNAFEAVEGWGEQKKYCLKANFIDHSHARNVVSAKLWGEIVKSRTTENPRLSALPNGGAVDGFPCIIMLNGVFHGLYTFNIPKDGWMFGMGVEGQSATTETETIGFDTYIENEINPLTVGYTQTAGITAFFVSKRSAVSGGRAYVSWDTQKIGQIAVRAYIFNSEGEYIKAFGFQSHPYGKDGHFGEDALLEPAAGITHYFTNNPISIAVPNDCTVMWECLLPASAPLPDGTLTHIWSTESETNGTWTYKWVKTGIEYYVEHTSAPKEAVLCAEYSEASGFRAEAVLDGSDFEIEYVSNEDDVAWVATSVNRLINACMNSDGNDLDTTIAQYLDWDSAIDYFIFKNLIYGVDIVGKNYILATYDGVKWFFSAYDLDSVFGLYPDGKKFLKANTDMFAFTHTVDALLVKYKAAEVKARYNELRQGVLSTDNVTDLFTNFIGKIPTLLLLEDVKKWPSVPNTSANNLAQIVDYYARRSDHIDADIKKYVGLDAPPEEPSDSLLDPTSKDWMNGMTIRQGDEPFVQASSRFAVSNYIYFKKGDAFVLEGASLLYVDGGYASLSVHFNDKTGDPIATASLFTLEQNGLASYKEGATTLVMDLDTELFNLPAGKQIHDGYIRLTISQLDRDTLDMTNVRLYRKND